MPPIQQHCWALTGAHLAAPSLVEFESANIIRRHELADLVSADQAAQAHPDLLDLAIEPWPFEILASRAWALRRNLTVCDASSVALAELTGATWSRSTDGSAAHPACAAPSRPRDRDVTRPALRV